jgi:hypothetical protein
MAGWSTRSTTELTPPVWFYLRGEEYSAQIDHFVQTVKHRGAGAACTFRAAAQVDRITTLMLRDAQSAPLQAAYLRAGQARPAASVSRWT